MGKHKVGNRSLNGCVGDSPTVNQINESNSLLPTVSESGCQSKQGAKSANADATFQ
ncbi:MAG: hypothetical protein LBK82_07065 [Planctomycetaceae bacterium]|nr:hypothetical protein [Planctomycetaceae bacterium]